MEDLPKKQMEMHKNFFDKCKGAIENGYYLEAIFLEYAAIESRLEVILGVLGLPCNKDIDDSKRKGVQISHRINCMNCFLKNGSPVFEKTKLNKKFFDNLNSWTDKRNRYIHGLYKNAGEYEKRKAECKSLAKKGYQFADSLYTEANRLKYIKKHHPERIDSLNFECKSDKCNLKNI